LKLVDNLNFFPYCRLCRWSEWFISAKTAS